MIYFYLISLVRISLKQHGKNCLAALIDQDTIGYYAAMQNVLTYGITSIDADKSAEREAKK